MYPGIKASSSLPSAPKSLKLDSLISIISARDPDVFDGETWPMFSAARPEWDYAWSHAKQGASLDDDLAADTDHLHGPCTTLGRPLVQVRFEGCRVAGTCGASARLASGAWSIRRSVLSRD